MRPADRAILITSAVVGLLTSAAMAAAVTRPGGAGVPFDEHVRRVAAVLSLTSALVLVARLMIRRRPLGEPTDARSAFDLPITAMVFCGMIAAALLVVGGIDLLVRWSRWFGADPGFGATAAASRGLIDAVAVSLAAILSVAAWRDGLRVAILFVAFAVLGLWTALAFGPLLDDSGGRGIAAALMPAWAMQIAVFTVLQSRVRQREHARAWPDELWRLTAGYPDWPGFRTLAGCVALAILLVGCAEPTHAATSISAFVASVACLTLCHRRFHPHLARLGFALMSLALISLPLTVMHRGRDVEWADAMPTYLNVAVFGFACMTFFWHWVAAVWDQQLHDGKAWTTAGRLIPFAHSNATACGILGWLAALQMSWWPTWEFARSTDTSTGRVIASFCGLTALTGAFIYAALLTQRRTYVGLMVAAVSVAGLFVAVRLGLFGPPGPW